MKKNMLVTAAFLLALAGCQQGEEDGQNVNHPNGKEYTVVDDRGEELTFESEPETVVSLIPSNTEILFELGVGDKVIGVSDTDVYPDEVMDIETVAEFQNIFVERIIELDPDVIIGYTYGEENHMQGLEDVGLPVFVIDSANSFDDIYTDIVQIAAVMGVSDRGEEVVNSIKSELDEVAEVVADVEPKELYLEVSPAPDLYTPGENTFQHEIIEAAGLVNAFADLDSWASIDEEQVIDRNPKIIATTVHYGEEDAVEEIKNRSGWGLIDAVEQEDVHLLLPDIMDRPGPRLAKAVRHLAETAYPEMFE